MRNAKLYGIVMMLILGISSVKAQDIHFSQFYASPMNMNPATTGVIGCDMRFSAIYRNEKTCRQMGLLRSGVKSMGR